jgi:dihydroorotate dehydrogenase (NAD+) catalytic subunit
MGGNEMSAEIDLSVRIGSMLLPNPVTVASGTFGYGEEYSKLIDLNQLGAVVVKGIRLQAMPGNPTPRTAEVTSGMLNAIGLQGPGVDGFIEKYWPFLNTLEVPAIINIWGTSVEEYAEVARRFDELGGVGALELNVSCPNIKEGGAQFGTDPELLSEVVAACRAATTLPLITKMSPNVVNIATYAKAAEDAGSDALSIMNSYPAMGIDIETGKPLLANLTGGLSGPAIRPIAIKLVWEASKAVKIPIIGMGGIENAADAIEFMMAGASAVAVGTANFYEPQTALHVISGIREFMQQREMTSLSQLVGSFQGERQLPPRS